MPDAVRFRFLPWTRRGLAAEVVELDNNGPLPARGQVSVGVTVTNVVTRSVPLSLYGPGDVIGIDPSLIVRCSPTPGSTNVEPNYFAAIEFDPPDFPWMFTPARASTDHHLRPWLVLIVVDRQLTGLPAVDRLRPLPVLTIPAEVSSGELPNLSESWAWSHSQVVTNAGDADLVANELEANPNLNVSRLICPRRLKPNCQYLACLVPAFDAGVTRGLGGDPDPDLELGPAWFGDQPGEVKLPVYFHWEFATGPLGDFESLARKLKPLCAPGEVGLAPMYIGDGGPELPHIPSSEPSATVMMDGALRSPTGASVALVDISQAIQDGLRDALNAPTRQLEEGPSDATPVLGPPLYGQWHARQHTIADGMPAWMRELNLDPRTRVSAGLGAEVVRKFQEDFMQQCWEQVGEILKANNQLNWGRLSLEAERRVYVRHFQPLPLDRLLQISAPLHIRTLVDGSQETVRALVRASSLPDATIDSAMRRMVSPNRPVMKNTIRRLIRENRLDVSFQNTRRSKLLLFLAGGILGVDPNNFVPDGVRGTSLAEPIANGSLREIAGIDSDRNLADIIFGRMVPVADIDFNENPPNIDLRDNLETIGLITDEHIESLQMLQQVMPDDAAILSIPDTLDSLIEVATQNPEAVGVLVSGESGSQLQFNSLLVDQSGNLQVFVPDDQTLVTVATLDPTLATDLDAVSAVVAALPPGTISLTAELKPMIGVHNDRVTINGNELTPFLGGRGRVNLPRGRNSFDIDSEVTLAPQPEDATSPEGLDIDVEPTTLAEEPLLDDTLVAAEIPATNTITIPKLVTDDDAVLKFSEAFQVGIVERRINAPIDLGALVPFALSQASAALISRLDPAVMAPRRLLEMVKLEAEPLQNARDAVTGVRLMPLMDRVMAAPDLPTPSYQYLASFEQERFCPGIGQIPPNSITLLETNPRFIESFLVGLNYEMNRELLWREFPTDQRGTPLRYFWNWTDGQPDIAAIHTWDRNNPVGANTRGAGAGRQIVLLVRGELIRRYPNAVLMAWRARRDANGKQELIDPPADDDIELPVFQGKLNPDIIFAGFKIRDVELQADPGWFFLVQEQPTEPRFGFDEPPENGLLTTLTGWRDVSWGHIGVPSGGYLALSSADPQVQRTFANATFGKNSAHMASITLQQPTRVAMHSRFLMGCE